MFLAVDIGNTNITLGVFAGSVLKASFALRTDLNATEDNYYVDLVGVLQRANLHLADIKGVAISSVVPSLTNLFISLLSSGTSLSPLVVGPGIKTGVVIKTANPTAVGADRIVNAVAVKQFYTLPALVVDFGTATTFDYVDKSAAYCGGLICPGLGISLEALVSRTSKLPRIELNFPDKLIGNDTVPAMKSGLMYGYLSLVEGLIKRVQDEVGELSTVVATGGLGGIFAERSELIDCYEPYLILKGLKFLYEMNHG